MPRILTTLPLIILLTTGTAISAQEDAATDAEQPAAESTEATEGTGSETAGSEESGEAAEGTAESGEQIDMGQEVEDPTYVKEQYGDWQLKCFRTESDEDPCQMIQLLHEEGGKPIAEFSLVRLPEGKQAVAAATVAVPLGTLLIEGLKISVDGGRTKSYPFRFCTMVGCFARIGLTQDDITAFKAGSAASLQIVPAQAPDQTVDVDVSLDGFTAAFDNVSVASN